MTYKGLLRLRKSPDTGSNPGELFQRRWVKTILGQTACPAQARQGDLFTKKKSLSEGNPIQDKIRVKRNTEKSTRKDEERAMRKDTGGQDRACTCDKRKEIPEYTTTYHSTVMKARKKGARIKLYNVHPFSCPSWTPTSSPPASASSFSQLATDEKVGQLLLLHTSGWRNETVEWLQSACSMLWWSEVGPMVGYRVEGQFN
ncbi:hypothetical protein RRG08_008422 [Elysia crispata]|uniref:Uncharacterized protein n=1 Tax=Elysia crispata TaxID=231223 RepID=A0AAE0ZIM0_9GAST|nr:hypothetical protein RRG08_008422 [Elysia crispata]